MRLSLSGKRGGNCPLVVLVKAPLFGRPHTATRSKSVKRFRLDGVVNVIPFGKVLLGGSTASISN